MPLSENLTESKNIPITLPLNRKKKQPPRAVKKLLKNHRAKTTHQCEKKVYKLTKMVAGKNSNALSTTKNHYFKQP